MTKALDIRDLDVVQLTDALKAMGEPGFRAKQIHQWLWQKGARSFEEMTNLSKPLREKLTEAFTFHVAKVHTAQHSKDGTIKVAFELHDGNKVEGVLIPTSSRTTACVSSQVGCSLDCKFCATGYLKRMRNLSAAEIFDQVWLINELALEHHGKRLDNIVYMGMGEPLANYSRVMKAVRTMIAPQPEGLGMSARGITVSTVGLVNGVEKLMEEGINCTLAISLHTPDDELRDSLVPINNRFPVREILAAADAYEKKTGRRYSIEYALIRDINDQAWRADLLGRMLKNKNAHVNLIPLNPTPGSKWTASRAEDEAAFVEILEGYGVPVTVRDTRGREIDGACGQLAASQIDNNA